MERFNIYHRQDGRYEGRISRGKRKNGKRRFQYFFGHSREEVQDKMTAARRHDLNGNCCKTVAQIFTEWFQSIHHRVKESTAANYRMKAEKHVLPAFSDTKADMITSSDIYTFIESRQSSGLSNRYISDILRTCLHKMQHTSFRQILPLTASKILAIRQYACEFFSYNRQNYARKSAH